MEIHKTRYLRRGQVSSHFKKLLQEFCYPCWALLTPTPPMQEWCRSQNLPAMVIGTGDEGNTLPNASIDYHALVYHAVGEILRRGHRRLKEPGGGRLDLPSGSLRRRRVLRR